MCDVKDKHKKGVVDESITTLVNHATYDATKRFTKRAFRIIDDAERLVEVAKERIKVDPKFSKGWIYEQLDVIKFNEDAFNKDKDYYAVAKDTIGKKNDEHVDILIKDGKNRTVANFQAKCSKQPDSLLEMISDDNYKKVKTIGPPKQSREMEELASKKISSGGDEAKEITKTVKKHKPGLEYKGVRSSGTSEEEARRIAEDKSLKRVHKKRVSVQTSITFRDIHRSAVRGAVVATGIGVGFSAFREIQSVYKGDKDIGAATAKVMVDGTKAFAQGYSLTALSKGVAHAISYFFKGANGRAIALAGAPAAIAAGMMSCGGSIASYLRGEIEFDEMVNDNSNSIVTGTFAFYYGSFGQVLIPIPVVGGIVGASVGMLAGHMLHQAGLISLGESEGVKAARERRLRVEAMCEAAIAEIVENRQELEAHLEKHFGSRRIAFSNSFDQMEDALINWDPDRYVNELSKINEAFGTILPFKTFEEFDAAMKSPKAMEF